MLRGFPREQKCIDCGTIFLATNPWNKRCGNRKLKTGCSYKARLKWMREVRGPMARIKYKDYYKKYDREWKRNRRKDPKYKEWAYEVNKRWRNSEKGRLWIKNHYKKYLLLHLESNRHRRLVEKGTVGKHSAREWEVLKKKFNYCCAVCGTSEKEIKEKWKGTDFNKLTKDHIIPISKGGTEFIDNIQPLCISCNAKKKDKKQDNRLHGRLL